MIYPQDAGKLLVIIVNLVDKMTCSICDQLPLLCARLDKYNDILLNLEDELVTGDGYTLNDGQTTVTYKFKDVPRIEAMTEKLTTRILRLQNHCNGLNRVNSGVNFVRPHR